ncbi:MAG: amino acid adenylation domain-containing protein [Bacteroidota bacterium]
MAYLLTHLVDDTAAQSPDQLAFRFGNQALTYAELARQSNQLANLLRAEGVERGDRVGIYLNRCLETAVAVYGILKAGAAFVPLDPAQPVARTQYLLDNCTIKILLTNKSQRRRLPDLLTNPGPLQLVIGGEAAWTGRKLPWAAIQSMTDSTPEVRILSDDLAYIIFSSGSTGQPKGIMHSHRSGLAYARLSVDLYGVKATDVIGNFCALHFDQCTFGYFSSMLAGATTIIVSDAHTKFPVSLLQLIEQEKMTIWYSVPLVMTQMIQSGALAKHDLSALRWVKFGGEAFSPHQLVQLMAHMPNAIFSNVYGPAEVNQCTFYHIDEPPSPEAPIPLGEVWDDTEILILDAADEPVTAGEVGELLVRSSTRMLGYWRDPERTERSFFQHRKSGGPVQIFYRTGDLVCTSAGRSVAEIPRSRDVLLFMGRKDRQIKTRGYRVELEEVESILNAQPGVLEAAVYPIKNGPEGLLIHALVVSDQSLEPPAIKQGMALHLPAYSIPAEIRFVQALPRTDAGKIDRRSLQTLLA